MPAELESAIAQFGTLEWTIIGVLATIQYALLIFAFIDLIKRSDDEVSGKKIVWVLVILFINMVGPILYLTLGRKPKAAEDSADRGGGTDRAQKAADALYGPSEGSSKREADG